jgi:hypothetical protein
VELKKFPPTCGKKLIIIRVNIQKKARRFGNKEILRKGSKSPLLRLGVKHLKLLFDIHTIS